MGVGMFSKRKKSTLYLVLLVKSVGFICPGDVVLLNRT